uniref:At1g61320/AtMIF1 LRR domain-containing protein n=1 Tax=Oryza punctata TaxID=4537 RepID=A0A0E0M384_ORYPU
MGIVEGTTDFIRKIDRVMKNHSGIGVKALSIEFNGLFSTKARSYLERWLQIAVTPRIEELSLVMSKRKSYYDFLAHFYLMGVEARLGFLIFTAVPFAPLRRLRLTYVEVRGCSRLRVIENKAPNLHSLHIFYQAYHPIRLSF